MSSRSITIATAFVTYASVRLWIFTLWPTQVTVDGAAYEVDEPLNLVRAVFGLEDKPGVLLQAVNLFLQPLGDSISVPPEGVGLYEQVPFVLWLFVAVSIVSWFMLALVIADTSPSRWFGFVAALITLLWSLLLPVSSWDRTTQSESLSLSLGALWLATWYRTLLAPTRSSALLSLACAVPPVLLRPSNAMVILPAMAVLLLHGALRAPLRTPWRSRRFQILASAVVVVFLVWTAGHFAVTSHRWSDVYDANRAVSLASLASYQELATDLSAPICPSAIQFSRDRWRDLNLYSWGAVSDVPVGPQSDVECLSGWAEMGEFAPGLLSSALSLPVQIEYWSKRQEVVLSGGDPFWYAKFVGGELSSSAESMEGLSKRVVDRGVLIWLVALSVGALTSVFLRRWSFDRRTFVAQIAVVSLMVAAVAWTAFVDGGDPARHALPWTVLIPIVLMVAMPLSWRRARVIDQDGLAEGQHRGSRIEVGRGDRLAP